ncbi:MAG: toxin-activating lysine-acyltransferase [Pseudomonadota bacterium]
MQDTADDPLSKKTVADVLGQIVWLMTQSKQHRGLFLSDLEWSVMPAILMKQFKIFYHEDQPKAAVFWAMVDEDTKARLDQVTVRKLKLREWKSGPLPYMVDAIAPFGDRDQLMVEMEKELKDLLATGTP